MLGATIKRVTQEEAEDWAEVSLAISARLAELGMTQTELATRAQVSLTTVRELVHNLNTRRRNPRTLNAIASVLGWPDDAIPRLLRNAEVTLEGSERDPVVAELHAIRAQLVALQEQISSLAEEIARPRPSGALESMRATLVEISDRLTALEQR